MKFKNTSSKPGLVQCVLVIAFGFVAYFSLFHSIETISGAVSMHPKHVSVIDSAWARQGVAIAEVLNPKIKLIGATIGIVILGLCLRILLPRSSGQLITLTRMTSVLSVLSITLFVLSVFLMYCYAPLAREVSIEQDWESGMYNSAARRLVLADIAEGRLEFVKSSMGRYFENSLIVEKDPTKVPRRYLSSHIGHISAIAKSGSPRAKKRALASLPSLEEFRRRRDTQARDLLNVAKDITGQEFERLKLFQNWVEPKLGTDGWDPLPIIYFDLPGFPLPIK